jgi:hypothetical protein
MTVVIAELPIMEGRMNEPVEEIKELISKVAEEDC